MSYLWTNRQPFFQDILPKVKKPFLRHFPDMTKRADIKALRKQAGLTQTGLAEAIGWTDQSAISKLERGERASTRLKLRLAQFFNVPVESIIDGESLAPDGLQTSGYTFDNIPSPNAAPADPQTAPLPPRSQMGADVPVYGTAAGSLGTGAFQLDMESQIDRVRRPPGVANATDVYAMYVTGDSMEPKYASGDLIYVSARRPARVGDDVVVQTRTSEDADPQAFVKRLARRTEKTLMLEQHNPSATIEVPTGTVVTVHRVFTLNDLFGV